jgi:hypothetical protein
VVWRPDRPARSNTPHRPGEELRSGLKTTNTTTRKVAVPVPSGPNSVTGHPTRLPQMVFLNPTASGGQYSHLLEPAR